MAEEHEILTNLVEYVGGMKGPRTKDAIKTAADQIEQ